MKKIDYYASQTPWKMPKWLGATLGGIFGVIAIGSGIMIIQLTKSNAPAPIAAVAAAPIAAPAAPAAAPAPVVQPSAPVVAAATPAPTATDAPQLADNKHHSKKHAHAKKAAAAKMASAKKPAVSAAQRGTILAKHDTKGKKSDKDQLDKLLGL